MSIGFLNENMSRCYPLEPTDVRDVCPWMVDLIIYLAGDTDYDIAEDKVLLHEINDLGAEWEFVFTVDNTSAEVSVPVLKSAEIFTTLHGVSGRSYAYLTVGDVSSVEAGTYDLPVEDRCIIAPESGLVESIQVANGRDNISLKEPGFFAYTPNDPVATFENSLANVQAWYDPDVVEGGSDSYSSATIRIEGGYSVDARIIGNEALFSLRGGAGKGWNCGYVVPERQSYRNTIRSFAGQLTNQDGDFQASVGPNMEIGPGETPGVVSCELKIPRDTNSCGAPGVEEE